MIAFRLVLSAILSPSPPLPRSAQTYPTRPIRLVVPFPAGGPTDTSARLVAQGMAAKLGQPIVIENQAGAGGAIGARQVASSAPDGYTLMIVSAAHTFGTQPILTKLDYDPFKTFVPVGMTVVDRQVMVMDAVAADEDAGRARAVRQGQPRQAQQRRRHRHRSALHHGAVQDQGRRQHRARPLPRQRADHHRSACRTDPAHHERQVGAVAAYRGGQDARDRGDVCRALARIAGRDRRWWRRAISISPTTRCPGS